jgi:iron complex outermembrane receptor protein
MAAMDMTSRNRNLACVIAMTLACAQATAEETAKNKGADLLDEVVVTATKRTVDAQTVPLSVTAISSEALVARMVTNIQGLDEVIPGLTIRSAGYNTAAIIRGAGSAGTSDVAVPFYTDGMFMPSNGQAVATFVDLERIEGLRGPQGTLFGRNTFGGLINIITRKPEMGKWDAGGAVTVGNYSQVKTEGMINVPFGNTLALRVTASRDRHDPYVKNTFNPAAGLKDADNQYVRAQLRWQPTDSFYVNLSHVDWKDDARGSMNWGYKLLGVPLSKSDPNVLDPINGYLDPRGGTYVGCPDGNRAGGASWSGNVCSSDPTQAAAARVTGGPFEVQYDTIPVHHAHSKDTYLTAALTLPGHELKLSAARFEYSYLTYVDADFTFLSNIADGESIHSQTEQADLTLTSTGNGPLRYTAGLYYYNRPLAQNSYAYLFASQAASWSGYAGATPSTPVWAYWMYGQRSGTESKAVYGQADYSLTDKLTVTAGARYTEDSRESVFSNSLGFGTARQTTAANPIAPTFDYTGQAIKSGKENHNDWRLGAQYQWTPNAMVYASWATSYIAGGPNKDTRGLLPPQENRTYELGTKTSWMDGALRLNATLYQATYQNLLTTVFTIFNGIPVARQIPGGSVRARGLEVEGMYLVTDRLKAEFSVVANNSNYIQFNVASRTGLSGVDFVGADGRGYFRTDGKQTPFSPKLTESLGLRYEIPLASGTITPRAQIYVNSGYQTSRDNAFFTKQPTYAKLDLSATWASADKRVSVQGYVNNATNKVVSTSTDITPAPNFQAYADYDPPRTFGVRIGYNF